MEEVLIPVLVVGILFLGLPWLVFHYVTKWKQTATITGADEKLLDELYDLARRLDDRLCTIERIMTAENPNWRQQCLPDSTARIEDDLDQTLSPRRSRSRITTGD
jgi:phage shock protein B